MNVEREPERQPLIGESGHVDRPLAVVTELADQVFERDQLADLLGCNVDRVDGWVRRYERQPNFPINDLNILNRLDAVAKVTETLRVFCKDDEIAATVYDDAEGISLADVIKGAGRVAAKEKAKEKVKALAAERE